MCSASDRLLCVYVWGHCVSQGAAVVAAESTDMLT